MELKMDKSDLENVLYCIMFYQIIVPRCLLIKSLGNVG